MSSEIESLLTQKIKDTLANKDIQIVQQLLASVVSALQCEPLQAAAAILCMDNSENELQTLLKKLSTVPTLSPDVKSGRFKMVRYRLEVGHAHEISTDEIKNVLISESGVERAKIGCLDMRNHYTLIDLPNGMPPDIFQHLQSVEINQHPLKIKRVASSKKRQWQRQRRKNTISNSLIASKPE